MSKIPIGSKFPLVRPIPHENFDSDAIKVYQRLRNHHYKTYFVGGCIRDLLLGRIPKDFDIVTSARPRQIRRIFPNSRLIGRRFLIVNVFFGTKNIEVTTFRKNPWANNEQPMEEESLLLNNENVFGTEEEDVHRRDFTINSILYEPSTRTIIDYLDGLEDLQNGIIRSIGDPERRFSEDPVRMLRAIKFKSMFQFELEKETEMALAKCYPKIAKASAARLLLELQKILRSGYAYPICKALVESNIMGVIGKSLDILWKEESTSDKKWLEKSLQTLDQLPKEERYALSDDILMAFIAFPLVAKRRRENRRTAVPSDIFCRAILADLTQSFSISKKMTENLIGIIRLQFFLAKKLHLSTQIKRILRNPHFTQAWEFFNIRNRHIASKAHIIQHWQEHIQTIKQVQNEKKQNKSKYTTASNVIKSNEITISNTDNEINNRVNNIDEVDETSEINETSWINEISEMNEILEMNETSNTITSNINEMNNVQNNETHNVQNSKKTNSTANKTYKQNKRKKHKKNKNNVTTNKQNNTGQNSKPEQLIFFQEASVELTKKS